MEKKKFSLPLIVLIVGIALGLIFAGTGLLKQDQAAKINEDRRSQALKDSQAKVDAANKRLAEIEQELTNLNAQYATKNQECNAISPTTPNDILNLSQCKNEALDLEGKINTLELEQFTLENGDYTSYYSEVKPMTYQIFYIIGGVVAGLCAIAALIIYLVKGKKETPEQPAN